MANGEFPCLTHTLTHTGKPADGNKGENSTADLILLEQKGPESAETQGLEGSQLFGKDEVGGSNPPSSSTKHLKSSDFGCFFVAENRPPLQRGEGLRLSALCEAVGFGHKPILPPPEG